MPTDVRDYLLFIQGRNWLDLVDILIVGFLIYWLFILIRGTQAFQIAIGVGLLAALGGLAEALHLQLLSFIFEKIGPAVLILFLILFQPELRRALEQVGRFSLVGRSLGQGSAEMINRSIAEVARACGYLARHHHGALVVFEREVGLEPYAASGVRMAGPVTAELLESIFYPGAPLHDGAVLIRQGLITAASCVLPLPEEMAMRERLGTRHRAALGLSLQSDAAVVVVSEETSTISLVHQGRIERDLSLDQLRRRLGQLLNSSGAGPGALVRRLRLGRSEASTEIVNPQTAESAENPA